MKKTNYDLSIFERGLKTRAFYYADILNLLYGCYTVEGCWAETEFGYKNSDYSWSLTNFQDIPMQTRRKLVKLLFKEFDILSDEHHLREEFYDRISCTLRTLLDKEQAYDERNQAEMQYDMYNCYFEELVRPEKVMKEFLMWHQMGLPVSEEEKNFLNECVTKFLSEEASYQGTTAQRIEWKRAKLRLRIKKLNKKMNSKCLVLDHLEQRANELKRKGKIVELNTVQAKINSIREEVFNKLYSEQQEYERQLGLAEAYPILKANFPSLEMLIAQYDHPLSDDKAC